MAAVPTLPTASVISVTDTEIAPLVIAEVTVNEAANWVSESAVTSRVKPSALADGTLMGSDAKMVRSTISSARAREVISLDDERQNFTVGGRESVANDK
jgi:hypothetical protein